MPAGKGGATASLTTVMPLPHSEKGNTVPGYDFLVNSVWPEIVRALEEHLPSLFNPGNPDAFHEVPPLPTPAPREPHAFHEVPPSRTPGTPMPSTRCPLPAPREHLCLSRPHTPDHTWNSVRVAQSGDGIYAVVFTALRPVTAQAAARLGEWLGGRWARRHWECWEDQRASPWSPGPGTRAASPAATGLRALSPGLIFGEILCEPTQKRKRHL